MTRLAVLADIHGNLPALQAVIDDMAHYKVDQVVVAGDSINWGPFSRGVMEALWERHWPLIRGNNEFYLLDYDTERAPAHWSRFTMPPYLHDQLGDGWVTAIAALPDTLQLRFRDAPPITGLPWHPGRSLDGDHAAILDGANSPLAARYQRAHTYLRAQPYRAGTAGRSMAYLQSRLSGRAPRRRAQRQLHDPRWARRRLGVGGASTRPH